ncbi:unnamed protein product, partial [Symbiodinium pilosum]
VWNSQFPFLKFRATSSHAQCTQCLRHQALISAYSRFLNARVAQQKLYEAHLRAQYLDRVAYWQNRAESRNRTLELVVIQDGMDQGKFGVPRHPMMKAKSMEGLVAARPRLHMTGILAHGWCLAFALSESTLAKDSNTQIELLAAVLTKIQEQGADLSKLRLTLQVDNCCREAKNNQVVRFLAALVSNGTLPAARIRNLRSGHSHEDIDQIFGQCAEDILHNCRRAETSDDFRRHLEHFLQRKIHRPHEEQRFVFKVDRTRDWKSFFAASVPVSLQGIGGPGAPHEFLLERRVDTGMSLETFPAFLCNHYHPMQDSKLPKYLKTTLQTGRTIHRMSS